MNNPFLTVGYAGKEYFCDRVDETAKLTRLLTNGNNVALISPRRMGKTGLVRHCFAQPEISETYYTFIIDIYATKCLSDMVYEMGKQIVNVLKPKEKSAIERFLSIVKSLRTGITFDMQGVPSWNVELGDIQTPQVTLEELFNYIEHAPKPCLIAIDEFQSISTYPEKNIEALLRTYIQHLTNANFVFSGSLRSMMSEMFVSAARPFYQSVTIMNLGVINREKYSEFIKYHFEKGGKNITQGTIDEAYDLFGGVTWYVQKIMNTLYSRIEKGETCAEAMLEETIEEIIAENEETYNNILYQITPKQKALLIAISRERQATRITSQGFIHRNNLPSASSIQKAALTLQEKQIITNEQGIYEVYDQFMSMWLKRF